MIIDHDYVFIIHLFSVALLAASFAFYFTKDAVITHDMGYSRVSAPLKLVSFFIFFLGLAAYFFYYWSWSGLLLGIFLSLLITFSLIHPKYAVSFFTFMMISRPWEFIKADLFSSFPRDIFYICAISFIGHSIIQKKFYFRWNMACAFTLAYAIWTFFSVFVTVNPAYFLNDYVEVFTKGIIIYFLIVNIVDKKDYINPIQVSLVISILEKAVISFYKSVVLGITADGERLTSVGILENSNDIAAILILSVPFLLARFRKGYSIPIKVVIYSFISLVYGYLVWESKSRGAILGYGALFIVWFFVNLKTRKQMITTTIIGSLVLLGLIFSVKRDSGDINESTKNRITYWKAGLKMGAKNPVLGVGYGNFQVKLFEYTDGHVGSEGRYKTVHSNWLLPLAETGVLGFVFYISIWITSLLYSWRMRKEHPEFIMAIASYGVAITFLTHTYMLYPWILLAIISSSMKFYRAKEVQEVKREILTGEAACLV